MCRISLILVTIFAILLPISGATPTQADVDYRTMTIEILLEVLNHRLKKSDNSAVKDFYPRISIVAGGGEKTLQEFFGWFWEQDGKRLGFLLTDQNQPSSVDDNPYVNITKKKSLPNDKSYEKLLADEISDSHSYLTPHEVLGIALDVCDGDYWLATLTCHNLLKEVAYAERYHRTPIVGWDPDNPYNTNEWIEIRPKDVSDKLQDLRPAGDKGEKMGPWYHTYGLFFVGGVTSGEIAENLAFVENFTRKYLWAPYDPFKMEMNNWAASLSHLLNWVVEEGIYFPADLDLSKMHKDELQALLNKLQDNRLRLWVRMASLTVFEFRAYDQYREMEGLITEAIRLVQESIDNESKQVRENLRKGEALNRREVPVVIERIYTTADKKTNTAKASFMPGDPICIKMEYVFNPKVKQGTSYVVERKVHNPKHELLISLSKRHQWKKKYDTTIYPGLGTVPKNAKAGTYTVTGRVEVGSFVAEEGCSFEVAAPVVIERIYATADKKTDTPKRSFVPGDSICIKMEYVFNKVKDGTPYVTERKVRDSNNQLLASLSKREELKKKWERTTTSATGTLSNKAKAGTYIVVGKVKVGSFVAEKKYRFNVEVPVVIEKMYTTEDEETKTTKRSFMPGDSICIKMEYVFNEVKKGTPYILERKVHDSHNQLLPSLSTTRRSEKKWDKTITLATGTVPKDAKSGTYTVVGEIKVGSFVAEREYRFQVEAVPEIQIVKIYASPGEVDPGDRVTLNVKYKVSGLEKYQTVRITERVDVGGLGPCHYDSRDVGNGIWSLKPSFSVPENVRAGKYTFTARVSGSIQDQALEDTRRSSFTVAKSHVIVDQVAPELKIVKIYASPSEAKPGDRVTVQVKYRVSGLPRGKFIGIDEELEIIDYWGGGHRATKFACNGISSFEKTFQITEYDEPSRYRATATVSISGFELGVLPAEDSRSTFFTVKSAPVISGSKRDGTFRCATRCPPGIVIFCVKNTTGAACIVCLDYKKIGIVGPGQTERFQTTDGMHMLGWHWAKAGCCPARKYFRRIYPMCGSVYEIH